VSAVGIEKIAVAFGNGRAGPAPGEGPGPGQSDPGLDPRREKKTNSARAEPADRAGLGLGRNAGQMAPAIENDRANSTGQDARTNYQPRRRGFTHTV